MSLYVCVVHLRQMISMYTCKYPPLYTITVQPTLSRLFHKKPSSTERTECNNNKAGKGGWAVFAIVYTELRQVVLRLNDGRVKVVRSRD